MVKWTKKYTCSNPNFKYDNVQHKHKKVNSKLLKSFIIEASMLPLSFDELNTKFEKL
jgi:hypothetical protein